jgi:Flp pilus assembly CpaE family ATPase
VLRRHHEEQESAATGASVESALRFSGGGGPVLGVAGAAGGAGASTLAWLVAAAAARASSAHGGRVLLADIGGPSAAIAVYAGVASDASLPQVVTGILGSGSRPARVYAETEHGLRVIAARPERDGTVDTGGLRGLLGEIRRAHALTVLDCGILQRPADVAAAATATHLAIVIHATSGGLRKAAARCRSLAQDSRARLVLVARAAPVSDRAPLQELLRLAEDARAPLILLPALSDPREVPLPALTAEAALSLTGLGYLLHR